MSSVQLKHNTFIFSFCSALNLLSKIFPLFCDTVLLIWIVLIQFLATLLHDTYCAKALQMKTFYSTHNISHTHSDQTLYAT